MNLLIVDDEVSSIRAVTGMLDAAALGIDRCFTAMSVQEARDCILNNAIDLLLCDIEMPQESGLELLEWVNAQNLDIVCIYMTCYAEFNYAQRAVKLGSAAYLLKPIDPEELHRELQNAVSSKRKRDEMRTAHRSLLENYDSICQQFWQNLFYEEIPSDRGAIREQIERLHLNLNADWLYCPTLVVVRNWGQDLEEDHRLNRYGIHNVVVELFQAEAERRGLSWIVFPFGQHGQMTICGGPDAQPLLDCARSFAQTFQETEEKYLPMRSVCYLGQPVTIEEMAAAMEGLMQMDNIRLLNHGIAAWPEEQPPLRIETRLEPLFERWGNLLENGRVARAREEILDFLAAQEGEPWFNKRRFRYFISRYAGMLTTYAVKNHFQLNQLTADPENADCFEKSDRGLDHMQSWVRCSLTQIERSTEVDDPVTATRKYIEAHLSETLELQQLSDKVHFNQDYLTRIFKRETGLSIKSYIVARRMEKARELLETSKLPIADVAYQVGYYNYTSFNRIFKKTYGASPQSYRRRQG